MTELWKPTRTSRLWKRGDPSGLPRNGLVALWDPYRDVYGRNVLPVGAEDFATGWWAGTGATITVTPGQPDPDGGNNAYKIKSVGGSSTTKYEMHAAFECGSAEYHATVWAKLLSGSCSWSNTDVDPKAISVEWSQLTSKRTVAYIYPKFVTAEVADEFEILAYHPRVNIGAVYPYSAPSGAPSTLQTSLDYSGNGNHLTLGATTNASTDDPAFTGTALLHAADFVLSGNLSGVTMAGDWTLPIICKPSGTANTLVSLADAAHADQYQAIEYNGSTKVRIKTCNGETPVTSDDLTVSASAVQMLVLTSSGDTLTLKRMDTGASVTATNADPTGAPRLCIGALGGNTVGSAADALEWHMLLLYRRAWTAQEAARAYLYSKSLMARRGVTLA